jgi:hypothetical protein
MHIPRGLQLVHGYAYQPPRFVYGWACPWPTIHRIALRCGLENALMPVVEEDEEGDPEAAPWLIADQATLILNKTLRQRFPDTMTRLGWVTVETVMGGDVDFAFCLALADSYETRNRKPSQEDIDIIREYFGIGTEGLDGYKDNQPLWWLDVVYPDWHWHDSEIYRLDTGWKKVSN